MKILVIHRHFWPDSPPYASLLREIGQFWVDRGHDVTAFSTQPSYKVAHGTEKRPNQEKIGGLRVLRCRLPFLRSTSLPFRLLKEFVFVLACFVRVVRERADVVMCSTMPPVMTGLATCLAARLRGSKMVYHCMDIYPEIALWTGLSREGLVYKLARFADTWTMRHASKVIVLSGDMALTCEKRGVQAEQLRVINNFELPAYEAESSVPDFLGKEPGKFRILFAGNLGRFQSLDMVIAAALELRENENLEFVFVGEGKAKDDLKSKAGELIGRTVFFHPHQPVSVIKEVMAEADLGLVSLSQSVIQGAYPSKTSTLLAQGCPILAVLEPSSDLSQMVVREEVGYACASDDLSSLCDTLRSAFRDRQEIPEMRVRAKSLAKRVFEQESVMASWDHLINELGEELKEL